MEMVDTVIAAIAQYASHVPQGLHMYLGGISILLSTFIPVLAAIWIVSNAPADDEEEHASVAAILMLLLWASAVCAGVYASLALGYDLLISSAVALLTTVILLTTTVALIQAANAIYLPVWKYRLAEKMRKHNEQNPSPQPGIYDRPTYRREI